MKEEPSRSAEQARIMRRYQKEGGLDQDEQNEDRHFQEDFEKAVRNHSKKAVTKDVQKQIEYFGYKMEAFNMKQEEELGQIDDEGYFVMANKRRYKDAWLDSLNDDGEEAIENMRKKIKIEQRQKDVFAGDKKLNENYNSDEEENSAIQQEEHESQHASKVQENKGKLRNIKIELSQLLPFSTSANQYMKKLKKQKDTELYDKILAICNECISITGQHDILTLKKEDLEEEIQEEEIQEQEPLKGWDDESEEKVPEEKPQPSENVDQGEQDDIF